MQNSFKKASRRLSSIKN